MCRSLVVAQAIECALKAVNVKRDEVIVPSFTIVSCLNAILKFGAKPTIVDVKKILGYQV